MKFAVIENEFGEVGIDEHILVEKSDEQVIEVMNGCIVGPPSLTHKLDFAHTQNTYPHIVLYGSRRSFQGTHETLPQDQELRWSDYRDDRIGRSSTCCSDCT